VDYVRPNIDSRSAAILEQPCRACWNGQIDELSLLSATFQVAPSTSGRGSRWSLTSRPHLGSMTVRGHCANNVMPAFIAVHETSRRCYNGQPTYYLRLPMGQNKTSKTNSQLPCIFTTVHLSCFLVGNSTNLQSVLGLLVAMVLRLPYDSIGGKFGWHKAIRRTAGPLTKPQMLMRTYILVRLTCFPEPASELVSPRLSDTAIKPAFPHLMLLFSFILQASVPVPVV
jgi:hypothetical protein